MKNYKLKINGNDYNVDINEVEGQEIKLNVNGTEYVVTVDQEIKQQPKPMARPVAAPAAQVAPAAGGVQKASAPAAAGAKVTTPLPGTILDVYVNVGDAVKAGQTVVLLEAMKMENNIEADTDGTVKEVKVRKGDSVLEGDVLVVIG
ncbi:MAG: biotin/lipoyl-binding protein [Bacteroidales bacterium]|nr:biotin/lipoyl-binding protein [Bacteroidales bacterium]